MSKPVIETALRAAKAALQNPQSISPQAAIRDIDLALGAISNDTRSILLSYFGRPFVGLRRHSEEALGVSYKTVVNQISAGTFPLPVFKQGGGWAVHIDDLTAHIDRLAADARQTHIERLSQQAAA